jgi:hypothetical protein
MIMNDINKSWQANNLQAGRLYVYAGTMETTRLVSIWPCECVFLETYDGREIRAAFADVLYATKDEVEDYLEDLRAYRDSTSTSQYK